MLSHPHEDSIRTAINIQPADTISVHVVDDDPALRASLEWALRTSGYVTHSHSSGSEFLSKVGETSPCCLIVDLLMPEMNGLTLCQEIAHKRPRCAFIVLTGHADIPTAVEAMRLGASDYLEKPCSREQLLKAVPKAVESLGTKLVEIKYEEEVLRRIEQLTAREKEVFDQVTLGYVSKQIASRLGISKKTVDVHRSRISQKLRLDSPGQLAMIVSFRQRQQHHLRHP